MKPQIQLFDLDDGGTVAVEVSVPDGHEERISRSTDVIVEHTGRKFSDALRGVESATRDIMNGFAERLKPDELELKFGLKFSAQAGIVLASADTEATLTMKAVWKSKEKPKPEN